MFKNVLEFFKKTQSKALAVRRITMATSRYLFVSLKHLKYIYRMISVIENKQEEQPIVLVD